MLRRCTKAGAAYGIHKLGVDRLVGVSRNLDQMPLVLCYHRVVENFESSAAHSIRPMLISAEKFEAQLDWIGMHYDFVSLDELAQALESGERFSKPIATVTFDDGYGDSYYHAFPILKRKGIPMSIFVVTDLVGSTRLQDHDELHLLLITAFEQWPDPAPHLALLADQAGIEPEIRDRICAPGIETFSRTRLCLELLQHQQIEDLLSLMRANVDIKADTLAEFHALSWEMLEQMAAGGVTIGSHTKSHKLLVNESWESILNELEVSRHELERRLGTQIRHFAYPDGRFNADAVEGLAVAGYHYAYTTCTHLDENRPLLTIPRRVLWENSCVDCFGRFSPSVLSCQINGIFDPAAKCKQPH